MIRWVELRRHTDNDGDVLTDKGIQQAVELGSRLEGGYTLAVSTGAQRATQTLACLLAGGGHRIPRGALVEPRLRSAVEDKWRAAFEQAGSGHLDALREADHELVSSDSAALGQALASVFERLSDGQRALVVGHSPTNEAAVLGLTDLVVAPFGKGEGALVLDQDGRYEVRRLD